MNDKLFQRVSIMLMMAILLALLFCAFLLVQLSKKDSDSDYKKNDYSLTKLKNVISEN